ncbi:hypothetical protein UPYG_G00307080 [Umbra pygmaea]|uniref:DUF4592 domain-containing protein n=1 Tax=Umbra pygmaea TaxID=75934 RepID=A0ABD0W358_UMBPY
MQSFAGEEKSSTEGLTGQNKSKLKTLKTRLFGKTKNDTKLSQSASDVTEGEGLGSAEDLCAGVLGSRALSHDSIFLAEEEALSVERPKVLSKESIHGRINELQMKLRQQNIRLGPPPLVLPMKRPEDMGGSSDDDGLPRSPPKILMVDKRQSGGVPYQFPAPPRHHRPLSLAGTGSEEEEQDSFHPWPHLLPPEPKPPPACPVPPTSSAPLPAISPVILVSDFNTPAQLTSCLDNSAARHRMSIKPKNQRASAKNKRLSRTELRPRSESLHNFYQPLTENEDEARPAVPGERTRSHSNQILMMEPGVSSTPSASPNLTPFKSGPTEALKCPNTSRPTLPCKPSPLEQPQPGLSVSPVPLTSQLSGAQQSQPSVSPAQDLRYAPQQQTLKQSLGGTKPSASSQTEREARSKDREPDSTQTTERTPKVDSVAEAQPIASLASLVALKTSSLIRKLEVRAGRQSATEPPAVREVPAQAAAVSTEGSPRPGSRSFRFSVKAARELDGPRRGSAGFLGVVEQAEAAVGRREERKEGVEGADASQSGQGKKQEAGEAREKPATLIDMGEKVLEGEELQEEENMEEVEEAVEAMEDECDGKTAFGVKLRSTSLSLRVRADAAAGLKNNSQEVGSPPLAPGSKPTGLQGLRDPSPTKASSTKKLSTNIPDSPAALSAVRGSAGWLRGADTETSAQPTRSPLNTEGQTSPDTQKEVKATSVPPMEGHQDPPASPQSAPRAAVSWMSMAWGKTRDLQQILTSSLPREFTGIAVPANQQDRNPAQPPTPSLAQVVTQTQRHNAAQTQITSQFSQQAIQPDLRSTTQAQGQAVPRTATAGATSAPPEPASALCSSPSQPSWSPRLLNHTPRPLPTSAPPTTPAPFQGPVPGRGQRKPVLQGRSEGEVGPTEKPLGMDRPGMVGERAAFLEKQMERSPLPGRRMELRATRTPPDSVASPKTTPTHVATKVAKLDERPESSPTKMSGSPADREDKWLRKNMSSSTSPSSSPSTSSPLQTMSDTGGQPSWMELAKRKSMAWNDKTMD